MAYKFNPFTGTLDLVGSGSGGGNAFTIIQPDSGTSPTATSSTSTLTVTSSANTALQVIGDSATNTLSLSLSDNPVFSSVETSGDLQVNGSSFLNGVDLNSLDITNGGGAFFAGIVTLGGNPLKLKQGSYLEIWDTGTKIARFRPPGAGYTNTYNMYLPLDQGAANSYLKNDGSGNLSWNTITTGVAWGAITGTLSSQTDLNTALGLKAPLASPTFSGTITTPLTASRALATGASSELAVSATTATELGYVSGVTSAIQTQINTKAPTASPTFSGTITTPLTSSRAVVTGASNELAISATTATELGYVSGVTSAIQTQLDGKATAANNQPARNYLINSAFDFWQRFGASPSQTVANTVSTYVADRWYIKNSLGTNGILTGSQVAGVTNGSKWGLSVKISTAPTAAQANGCELYQALENIDSLNFYGQTASFGILVKALGNVTQVGVQFYYKTTEAKVDTSIGSEVLTTVNSSTFVQCSTLGQAIGTSQTTGGIIGIRCRITAVSSGNLYALNNGFIVEQGQINLGSTLGTYQRAGNTNSEELRMCQRFYAKSYDLLVAPGTASNFNGLVFTNGGVATSASHAVNSFFKVSLRTAPTATSYDLAGASGKYTIFDSAGTPNSGFTPSGFVAGENSVYLVANAVTTPGIGCHYTVDAEI